MVVVAQLRSILVVGLWLAVMRPVPNWTGVMAGVGVGAISCASITLLFRSLSTAPSALVSPLCAVLGGVVSACIGLAMGEHLTPLAAAGGIIGLAGVGIPAATARRWLAHPQVRALLDATIAGVASGVAIALIGLSAPSQLPWLLLFERLTTVSVLSALTKTRPHIRLSSGNEYGVWIVAVGYVAASWALRAGTVEAGLAVTAIIASCYPVVTIILSVFFDEERIGPWRILSLALALCGLAMLTAGHS